MNLKFKKLEYEPFDNYQPPSWNTWFMKFVYLVSYKSKDTKTKIGAVVVKDKRILSVGYNGMPMGVDDSKKERYERPLKYSVFCHAEVNCLYAASYAGISLKDATLITQSCPCNSCTQGIIQSGIKKIILHQPWEIAAAILVDKDNPWYKLTKVSEEMLNEAKIEIQWIKEEINETAYINGYKVRV